MGFLRPPTSITHPHTRQTYNDRLYDIHISHLSSHLIIYRSMPHHLHILPFVMVERVDCNLQHGQEEDHTHLHGEHLIYAMRTLATFPKKTHTIVPIHNAREGPRHIRPRKLQDYPDWLYIGQIIWGNTRGRVKHSCKMGVLMCHRTSKV